MIFNTCDPSILCATSIFSPKHRNYTYAANNPRSAWVWNQTLNNGDGDGIMSPLINERMQSWTRESPPVVSLLELPSFEPPLIIYPRGATRILHRCDQCSQARCRARAAYQECRSRLVDEKASAGLPTRGLASAHVMAVMAMMPAKATQAGIGHTCCCHFLLPLLPPAGPAPLP